MDLEKAAQVLAYQDGIAAGVAGKMRSENPYARGWSRDAVCVLPGDLSEQWDNGWQFGWKIHRTRGNDADAGAD